MRLLLVTALALRALSAHEISLQQSTVDFLPDGTWHLALSTDPLVLLAPEARAAGADPRAAWTAMNDDERRARLAKVRALFADNVSVRFDGAAADARVSLPSAEPVADEIDRLVDGVAISGRVPAGAKRFTVSTTPHIGPMVLILRRDDDDEPVTIAVEPGGTCAPFRLDRGSASGRGDGALRSVGTVFTGIAPAVIGCGLAVLGLFLLGARLRRRRRAPAEPPSAPR